MLLEVTMKRKHHNALNSTPYLNLATLKENFCYLPHSFGKMPEQ